MSISPQRLRNAQPLPIYATLRTTLRVNIGRLRSDLLGIYRRVTTPDEVCIGGVSIALADWWATPRLRDYIYTGRYEAPEYEILVRTLTREDRYMELGAGIGFLTTCACQRVGAERVFAYEADARLARVTAETASRNGFRPSVSNVVLGGENGTARFYLSEDFWTSSLTEIPGGRCVNVPQRSFAAELDRVRPTYLMVDIEGGEVDLFRGTPLPAEVRAICMETHPDVVGARAIQELLTKLADEGFVLDLGLSRSSVAFLTRQ
jgi:FkbM family methyltransferase